MGSATATRAALGGCPVEVPVSALRQPSPRTAAVRAANKAVQRGQLACRGDFEDRAITATAPSLGRPIEVPVDALHHAGRLGAIRTVKIMQRNRRAGRSDFKDRATGTNWRTVGVGPATLSYSVEVPV